MPNTEHDLEVAVMDICREDTGAGGLVPLTGKTVPLVLWNDLGKTGRLPPIMALQVTSSALNIGLPESLNMQVMIDAFAKANSEGLEYQLLERFDEVVTVTNLLTKGLDAAPYQQTRTWASDIGDGRRQATIRYAFTLKR